VFDLLLAQFPHLGSGREAEDKLGVDLLLAILYADTGVRVANQRRRHE
jgi:hypothetical protein